jgi:hypothetical protein
MHQNVKPSLGAAFDPRILATERGKPEGGEQWVKNLHYLGNCRPRPDRPDPNQLGQWEAAAGALFDAYKGVTNGAPTNGGPVTTGPTTGMQQPGGATVVSPTFQTQISPQISPTFQQTQASPGAVQAATATQYMPGGMFAEGGSAASAPPTSPYGASYPDFGSTPPIKYGGLPVSPLDPVHLTDIRSIPTAGSLIRDIRQSEPFDWTPVYWIGGIALVGALAFTFVPKRRAA